MHSKLTFGQSIKAGLLAGLVAAVIDGILFFVFHAAGVFTDNVFIQPNQPLTIVPVLIASFVPAILGSIVFFLIEKYTNRGFTIFRILTLILVVLSMYSPFALPHATLGYSLVLGVMHIVVPTALLYFIGESKKQRAVA